MMRGEKAEKYEEIKAAYNAKPNGPIYFFSAVRVMEGLCASARRMAICLLLVGRISRCHLKISRNEWINGESIQGVLHFI